MRRRSQRRRLSSWSPSSRRLSHAVVLLHPLPVAAARGVRDPFVVGEVPPHGLAQPGGEALGGLPAELGRDLARIDGGAPVVARAGLHISDEIRILSLSRTKLVEQRA